SFTRFYAIGWKKHEKARARHRAGRIGVVAVSLAQTNFSVGWYYGCERDNAMKRARRDPNWFPRTIEESIDYQTRRMIFKGQTIMLPVRGTWPPDPPIPGVPVIRSPFELFSRKTSET